MTLDVLANAGALIGIGFFLGTGWHVARVLVRWVLEGEI